MAFLMGTKIETVGEIMTPNIDCKSSKSTKAYCVFYANETAPKVVVLPVNLVDRVGSTSNRTTSMCITSGHIENLKFKCCDTVTQ